MMRRAPPLSCAGLQSLAIVTWCILNANAQSSSNSSSGSENFNYTNCDGDVSYIKDGVCDTSNNNAECGYDGGDCCECTCEDGADSVCGERGGGFYCLDPDAPCEQVENGDYLNCTGNANYIEDGVCDVLNNNAACGYDGGDCCECTCQDDLANPCGERGGGFFCVDPDAPCEKDGNATTPAPVAGPSTSGPTASPTVSAYPDCTGTLPYIGDGICDSINNNAECGYDGGDCCECTCGARFGCGVDGFDCVDPGASTDCFPTPGPTIPRTYTTFYTDDYGQPPYVFDDDDTIEATLSPSLHECYPGFYGDGDCDSRNNNLDCEYDGGDCCECQCVDSAYECGVNGYDCIDPSTPCTNPRTPSPSYRADDVVDTAATSSTGGDGIEFSFVGLGAALVILAAIIGCVACACCPVCSACKKGGSNKPVVTVPHPSRRRLGSRLRMSSRSSMNPPAPDGNEDRHPVG